MMHLMLFLVLFSPFSAFAESFVIDPAQSTVEFLAIGRPSALKIKGTGAKPEGTLKLGKAASGEIKVDLDSFNSGISMRDRHMKEKYLETGKEGNRYATFTLATFGAEKIPDKSDIAYSGTLKVHGVPKPLAGTINWQKTGTDATATGTWKLKLTDFSIAVPSFSGITVAEDVEVTYSLKGKVIP